MSKSPYEVVKYRYVTEKSTTLASLASATSNRSLSRCDRNKVVFVVDPKANKQEIARAVEAIYSGVQVQNVNTIRVKRKPKRRTIHGRGKASSFKKAVVTLKSGYEID